MGKGHVDLNHVSSFVLDEADQMLDKRTLDDVNTIVGNIKQFLYFVDETNKLEFILSLLSKDNDSVLIFTRTKKIEDKVCKAINIKNIRAKAIHGDKSQSERIETLSLFKSGDVKVLVATDVAARGIDIKGISLVINMDILKVAETYVHRIGRTGRAGYSGLVISFCSDQEKECLDAIEALQLVVLKLNHNLNWLVNIYLSMVKYISDRVGVLHQLSEIHQVLATQSQLDQWLSGNRYKV